MARELLIPARALRHPAYWAALAVLLLNDHVLKGAGLVPGLVTGKLSDVAGLFVAPPLLATILRLRSRSAVAAAFLVTGVVFAALELSPAAVHLAERLLAPLSWRLWPDPTDLLALPALLVAWRVLGPTMHGAARDGRALA